MHITCAFIIGYGLRVFRRPGALKASGIFALLCVAITFHATFNMLMKTDGLIKQFGYAVPIVSCLILFLLKYRFRKKLIQNNLCFIQTGKKSGLFCFFRGNFIFSSTYIIKGWIEEVCELKSNAERMSLVFARAKKIKYCREQKS